MEATPRLINLFLLSKLPAAYICGVRVEMISKTECITAVKHRWINQNPFRSMYFAVQAMAAELSTGALVLAEIKRSKAQISMLVVANKAEFFKKATGKIIFTCKDGALISETIQRAIQTKEGQLIWLRSTAVNDKGERVAEMEFQWSVKAK